MAILARHDIRHDDPLRDEYMQMPFPRPAPQFSPSRGPTKAQKSLGLVTDFSRPRSVALELPPLRDASKAKRTLGIVTDLPRDRKSWRASVSGGETYQGSVHEMLAKAEQNVRISLAQDVDDWGIRTGGSTQRDTLSSTRGWIDIALAHDAEPAGSHSQLFTPPLDAQPQSPSQLSSVSPIDLDAEMAGMRDLAPPRPLGSPRPRPLSFASSSLAIHARPHNKIASSRSRGLRANSYPNFSRPIAPKPVPGEEMERDPLYLRYQNEPPTPASPVANDGRDVFDGIVAARAQVEEHLKRAQTGEQQKPVRRGHKKARWSSLPISLLQFAKKRASKTEEENLGGKKAAGKKNEKIDLTEDNLQRWEDEVGYVPKMYRLGYDILRSPIDMDMQVERATSTPTPSFALRGPPELPKLETLSLLTPPSSPPQTHVSFAASSKPRASPIPRPMPLSLPTPPLDGPNEPTLAAQKEYLASLVICTICKEAEPPSTFPSRKITSKCKHKTQTCKECIRQWVETCVETRGWNRCTCPECGETLSHDDAKAFLSGPAFER